MQSCFASEMPLVEQGCLCTSGKKGAWQFMNRVGQSRYGPKLECRDALLAKNSGRDCETACTGPKLIASHELQGWHSVTACAWAARTRIGQALAEVWLRHFTKVLSSAICCLPQY